MPVRPGQALLHYRLVEKIGAGGMGEVWRAIDSRLGREVAVKVLPDTLASDPDAVARFEREARAVAALSHPNILALYDVGREDGTPFVVTELLRGGTLRERLAAGPMTRSETLELAIQIAQGLAAAHARGLVHRDLKPDNVFVAEGGAAKILDFGLARFDDSHAWNGEESRATTLAAAGTLPGMVIGSPGYMSPEQVRGQVADARADLFAFGAVLYEMASGRRAFSGLTPADTLSAVLHDEPPALRDAALDVVIRKCLMKPHEQRYATAREVIQALESARSGVSAKSGSAIAVLPFSDMSQSKDQDYFCEGMAEEIISALSAIPGVQVAARTSTFQFKGTQQDVRRIGQALGVDKVLEGSVRTAGGKLRVTAQLINVDDGYHLWTERYDRQMEDVFAIQDEIARSVSQALAGQLGARHVVSPGRKHSDDLEAYHLYLKGRHERYTTRNFEAALKRYEEAIERDPRYALARLGIAEASILLGNSGYVRPRVTVARAETELSYANALAEESAESRAVECAVRMAQWRLAEAEAAGRRAVELDPRYIFGWTWLSLTLGGVGRFDEAHEAASRAAPIDPLSAMPWAIGGWALSAARRFEDAEAPLRRALELTPTHGLALWQLGVVLAGQGRCDEAADVLDRAHQGEPTGSSLISGIRAWTRAKAGQVEEARAHLEELRDWAKFRYLPRFTLAWTLGELGDIGGALDEFERSVEEGDAFLMYPLWPGNDPYRNQPRFKACLERLGMHWAIHR